MEREQIQSQQNATNHAEQAEIQIHQQKSEVDQSVLSETDDLLAEIDGLLEENAEDFVKGFVQKGGQ